jgi:hypothetical protein
MAVGGLLILAGIMLAGGVVGAMTGAVTGEGATQGFQQGMNVLGNSVSALMSIGKGEWGIAGAHMLGMSEAVIQDIRTGDFKTNNAAGRGIRWTEAGSGRANVYDESSEHLEGHGWHGWSNIYDYESEWQSADWWREIASR